MILCKFNKMSKKTCWYLVWELNQSSPRYRIDEWWDFLILPRRSFRSHFCFCLNLPLKTCWVWSFLTVAPNQAPMRFWDPGAPVGTKVVNCQRHLQSLPDLDSQAILEPFGCRFLTFFLIPSMAVITVQAGSTDCEELWWVWNFYLIYKPAS